MNIYEQAVVKPSAAAGSERNTSKHLSGIARQPACHLTYQWSAFIQENEVHNGLMFTLRGPTFYPIRRDPGVPAQHYDVAGVSRHISPVRNIAAITRSR